LGACAGLIPAPRAAATLPAPAANGTIYYRSDRTGDAEIYGLNPDGSVTRLTNSPGFDDQADVSPRGTRIAFTSHRTGTYQVWSMNTDGSDPVDLSNSPAT